MNWKRVTRANPCPICGKPDWCRTFADGWVECMRTESAKPARSGGWMHRNGPAPAWICKQKPPPPPRRVDMGAIWADCMENTDPSRLADHAASLGLPLHTLVALGCAWYSPANAWAWPMWAGGRCCGIRLRNDHGKKWTMTGSQAGLFVAEPQDDTLLICEGPTDTAAALSLGFSAVGRPSCMGQEDLVRSFVQSRIWKGGVWIIADRDTPKTRPDGSTFLPGQQGAERLAKSIGKPIRIAYPPAKDMRSWVQSGASRAVVECVINAASWRNLK